MLIINPIYHQVLVLTYPAPKNIGELLNPKCVSPEDNIDKNVSIKAATISGTPEAVNNNKNVGNNTVM